MPGRPAPPLYISDLVRRQLKSRTAPAEWWRREVILLAADGLSNAQIARELYVTVATVRKWRRRFEHDGLDRLLDRTSGRRIVFTTGDRGEAIRLASEPDANGRLRSAQGVGEVLGMSESTIRRIWHQARVRRRPRAWVDLDEDEDE